MSVAAPQGALARFDASGSISFQGPETRLRDLRQNSPIRFLRPVPEPGDPTTVVLVNTAGGVVGGDGLTMSVSASDGAAVLATGQAAEKIYRSSGDTAELSVQIAAQDGAALEYVPQGTILFDGARMRRRTTLSANGDATLLYGEILHFGRTAMGETFASGLLGDRTDIHLDGRRVLVDALRLDGDMEEAMAARSGLNGATCAAVMYCLGPKAERARDAVREITQELDGGGATKAAAARFENGPMVARMIARDGAALRRDFARIWSRSRFAVLGRPEKMPRIWSI